MPMDRETTERLLKLELGLEEAQKEISSLEKRMGYYDKMAIKWGGILMGATAVGALVTGHFDALRTKIMELFTW